jgi:hypothetical protein
MKAEGERHAALAALERLLADAPPCTAQEGMDAVRCSVAWRDALVRRRRQDGPSPALDRELALANGVLGLTWSGVVPVTGFRRGRLEKAREALRAAPGGQA